MPSTGTFTIAATSYEIFSNGGYTLTLTGTAAAPTCNYSINPGSANVSASGGGGGIAMTAQSGCAWTAISNSPAWLSIAGAHTGSGGGTINFTANPNASTISRAGAITVGGKTFNVTQNGANSPTTVRTPFDYDGDGKADVSVFRPSNGARAKCSAAFARALVNGRSSISIFR